jgi:hypothetical protein
MQPDAVLLLVNEQREGVAVRNTDNLSGQCLCTCKDTEHKGKECGGYYSFHLVLYLDKYIIKYMINYSG